ncbi:MAG: NAD-dependent epimerase/dehydratase family protein [Candidatus Kapaibacteriota bacterium]
MKILVTGGAGFIGSHIVDAYISLGHHVAVVDNLSTGDISNVNPKAEFLQLDINDPKISIIVENGNFDVINHHAAQIDVRISVDDPVFDAQNNILGSLRLYSSAVRSKVKKIIFASSGGTVYGEQQYYPANEEHPLNPCSPYGISKLTNELYLSFFQKVYGIQFVAFRYSNVYGPRQNPNGEAGVIAIFSSKLLKGVQPIIYGDGTATRDYVYITDVIRANVLSLNDKVNGIFNISTGVETDVNTIYKKLKEIIKSDLDAIHGPAKPGEIQRSCLSYEKFQRLTGWEPEIDLDRGLQLTVDFFRNA